jgi:hypothetical protein
MIVVPRGGIEPVRVRHRHEDFQVIALFSDKHLILKRFSSFQLPINMTAKVVQASDCAHFEHFILEVETRITEAVLGH